MNCVVLAGGTPDEVARLQDGAPNKAFIEVGGVTLVERTLAALRASRRIERVVVVAPESAHGRAALALADEVRSDGERISDSLRRGLSGFAADEMVLVAASDMPVLSGRAVDDFIGRALETDADVGYGCVERSCHLAAFPDVPHTWARLRDGTFCGGGLVAIKPRILTKLEEFIEELGAARKQPLRLASLFGWDVLLRYALGRLGMVQAEQRASELLAAPARAIVSPYAETAVNVDRVSDVALAEHLVNAGVTSTV